MTKEQMQQVIDKQEQQIKELSARASSLESQNEDAVKASKLYQSLQYENKYLREEMAFYQSAAKLADDSATRLKSQLNRLSGGQIQQILKDNQELLKEHDASYWIGITQTKDAEYLQNLEKENNTLKDENTKLQDKLFRSETQVKRLQNMLTIMIYEQHPEDMPELESEELAKKTVMGRPKTGSIAENIKARQLRKQGYTVREIADRMGWSIGLTQKTVASVSVDPEVLKQHRKDNRKKGKSK